MPLFFLLSSFTFHFSSQFLLLTSRLSLLTPHFSLLFFLPCLTFQVTTATMSLVMVVPIVSLKMAGTALRPAVLPNAVMELLSDQKVKLKS